MEVRALWGAHVLTKEMSQTVPWVSDVGFALRFGPSE
jgi:hypothetical protein